MFRFVIAALLLAGLVSAGDAAALAPKRPPAHVPPRGQPLSCSASDVKDITHMGAPPEILQQITPTTPLVAERAPNTLLIRKPTSQAGPLHYRILDAPPNLGFLRDADVSAVHEQRILSTQAPDAGLTAGLGITTPQDWDQVTYAGPGVRGETFGAQADRILVVYACTAQDAVYASGTAPITVSRFDVVLGLVAAFIVLIYLVVVTAVFAMRRRAALQPQALQPPMRWHAVTPVSWLRCLDPVVVCADTFDQASLPKVQILIFTLVVAASVLLLDLRTGVLTDLSPSIALLLGLPALGGLGANAAAASKDRLDAANWAWLVNRGVLPMNDRAEGVPNWNGLILTDGELDIYKVQAAAFSVVVVIALLVAGSSTVGKFVIPDTELQILGLSQLVYVGGRFVKPATLGQLNVLLTELKARNEVVRSASLGGRDIDAGGAPSATPALVPGPYASRRDAAQPGAIPNAVRRYEDLEGEVATLLQSLARSVVDHHRLEPDLR